MYCARTVHVSDEHQNKYTSNKYSSTLAVVEHTYDYVQLYIRAAQLLYSIKTGTFGQPELFDPKLMQLHFDPGVENRIFV